MTKKPKDKCMVANCKGISIVCIQHVESARKEGAINLIEEVLEISLLPHQIEWLYKKREAIKKEVK